MWLSYRTVQPNPWICKTSEQRLFWSGCTHTNAAAQTPGKPDDMGGKPEWGSLGLTPLHSPSPGPAGDLLVQSPAPGCTASGRDFRVSDFFVRGTTFLFHFKYLLSIINPIPSTKFSSLYLNQWCHNMQFFVLTPDFVFTVLILIILYFRNSFRIFFLFARGFFPLSFLLPGCHLLFSSQVIPLVCSVFGANIY